MFKGDLHVVTPEVARPLRDLLASRKCLNYSLKFSFSAQGILDAIGFYETNPSPWSTAVMSNNVARHISPYLAPSSSLHNIFNSKKNILR